MESTIINYFFKQYVNRILINSWKSPNFNSIYLAQEAKVAGLLTTSTIANLKSAYISASELSKKFEQEYDLFNSVKDISSSIFKEINNSLVKYRDVYIKINDNITDFRNKINSITNRQCLVIETSSDNENSATCSYIGNYLTLPYFIDSATVLNTGFNILLNNNMNLDFSNLESITSFPLTKKPTAKFTTIEQNSKIILKIVFAETQCNAFYIGFNNILDNITVNLLPYRGVTFTNTTNDIFCTFDKQPITGFEIILNIINTNLDKPYSVSIDNFIIFTNLEFASKGNFISNLLDMTGNTDVNKIGFSSNIIDNPSTKSNFLMNITSSKDNNYFTKVELDNLVDFYTYQYGESYSFLQGLNTTIEKINNENVVCVKVNDINTDFKKATLISGINLGYMDTNNRFNNWLKKSTDNFYTSNLINFSEDLVVDIGDAELYINEKLCTGEFTVPVGISTIKVYEKHINIGEEAKIDLYSGNPNIPKNNIAFLIGGIPEYTSTGPILLSRERIPLSGSSSISLGAPIIPASVRITDDKGRIYTMHLSKNLNKKGTFLVDHITGTAVLKPFDNTKYLNISAVKSSRQHKSFGILFKRLITYGEYASISDPNYFSVGSYELNGVSENRLYFKTEELNQEVFFQLLYNNSSDRLYISSKIELQSENKYISPAIKNIYIATR